MKRVVTGYDQDGKSVVVTTGEPPCGVTGEHVRLTYCWETKGLPVLPGKQQDRGPATFVRRAASSSWEKTQRSEDLEERRERRGFGVDQPFLRTRCIIATAVSGRRSDLARAAPATAQKTDTSEPRRHRAQVAEHWPLYSISTRVDTGSIVETEGLSPFLPQLRTLPH